MTVMTPRNTTITAEERDLLRRAKTQPTLRRGPRCSGRPQPRRANNRTLGAFTSKASNAGSARCADGRGHFRHSTPNGILSSTPKGHGHGQRPTHHESPPTRVSANDQIKNWSMEASEHEAEDKERRGADRAAATSSTTSVTRSRRPSPRTTEKIPRRTFRPSRPHPRGPLGDREADDEGVKRRPRSSRRKPTASPRHYQGAGPEASRRGSRWSAAPAEGDGAPGGPTGDKKGGVIDASRRNVVGRRRQRATTFDRRVGGD